METLQEMMRHCAPFFQDPEVRWMALCQGIDHEKVCLLAALPVGNEGMNLYIGILGIHSLIPY